MRTAIERAENLSVPLVVAGDLVDGKAIIRGECANAILDTMYYAEAKGVLVYVIPGNHCMLNEKASAHSLNFLREHPAVILVDEPQYIKQIDSYLIPYFNDAAALQKVLGGIPAGSRIIMHQGVMGANLGHYVQDKTSLPPEAFADFRVISGHYHQAQDIKCGRPRKGAVGLFTYIGSPYTQSFAEANDPGEKGFRILMTDGTTERVPTNLRRHRVIEKTVGELKADMNHIESFYRPDDLIWLKVTGAHSELSSLDKRKIGAYLQGHSNFKLEKIPTDNIRVVNNTKRSGEQLMDALIDSLDEPQEEKTLLKGAWREVA